MLHAALRILSEPHSSFAVRTVAEKVRGIKMEILQLRQESIRVPVVEVSNERGLAAPLIKSGTLLNDFYLFRLTK